ncbi:MAG: hypothetical protein PHP54_02915 [Clostridia bacterium]|nr:hypothetical protein [Clostridia bacterium]
MKNDTCIKTRKDVTITYIDKNIYLLNGKESSYLDILVYVNKNVKSISSIIFKFNFSDRNIGIEEADNIILNIKKIDKPLIRNNNILVKSNINKGISAYEDLIRASIKLCNINDKKERYNFLYDEICDYLDEIVVKNNVCRFENDKCVAKKDTKCTMGCCHHYKNKYFGVLYERNLHLCEYQKDNRCQAKCITCKMYMCADMKKKGYKFTTQNVLLIKRYFNIAQKLVIVSSFFTTKERIMRKLLLFSI